MPRYRFGTYDFDPGTLALRRDGSLVRLQAQPAQVLAVLLEHAPEIVTRETLQQTVWGADGTQVDFERGLNFCIAQVRSALNDSADSPRFVRTIPKKGYQFIAPVERVEAEASAAPKPQSRRPLVLTAAALLIIAASGVALLANRYTRHVPIVAVTLFSNETGDPAVDSVAVGFSDAMTVNLASTSTDRVKVIGNAAILRQPRTSLNFDQIHTSLQADYVVIGQVQKDSIGFRILAHLLRLPGQTHVTVDRLDTPTLDNPLAAEDAFTKRATQRFLGKIQ
ncbi:MAG TPA: winged helix-turn-helix domain-containing protein [Bryobacteraceae bacterium]|jgi:DNA-binding winged helix-turn-helix (wHTH) protein